MPSARTDNRPTSITVHDRTYSLPTRPTVVVCIDGFDPTYLQYGIEDNIIPTLESFVKSGFHATAHSAMPSLTNPNNLSIITGAPTAVHGVSGNYYLDTDTGEEIMITDASLLKGSTILAELAKSGLRVAAITAKDKLRRILCAGLVPSKDKSICFSAQHARDATLTENGIENVETWLGKLQPAQYSADLSLFVLDAGFKLLEENRADVFYLTLSDYIQHHHAPRCQESNLFMKAIDDRLAKFISLGAVVAVTGDHGMNDKCHEDGTPNVLFLEDFLNTHWPEYKARVICPIADPFVKHHGALGGFVRVHFLTPSPPPANTNIDTDTDTSTPQKPPPQTLTQILSSILALPQVQAAYTGPEASKLFTTPPELEGHLAVIAVHNAVIGSTSDEHDLSMLRDRRLRSHGGLAEREVPLLRSEPLVLMSVARDGVMGGDGDGNGNGDGSGVGRRWRNFDVFDVALNYH